MKFVKNRFRSLRRASGQDRERGAITVAETLIALGIGATVLAVVFGAVPALIDSRNTSKALSGLAQAATTVRMTFGMRNNYTGLTADLASQLAGFPRQFFSAGDLKHPWGGDINFAAASDNAQHFTIEFEDMPSDACVSLVTSSLDLATSVTVGSTAVDMSVVNDTSTTAGDEGVIAKVAGLCTANVDVRWEFTS